VLPYNSSFRTLLGVGLFLPFTGPMANLLWLFAGAGLQKLFTNHRKAVDIVMAVSLALCAVSLVWPHG
jgi:cysteine/O-acetylserine efflux protein